MPFHSNGDIKIFTFNSFNVLDIPHGIFTRRGGVSPDPWKSLNVGGTVGDDPERVRENRRLTLRALPVDSGGLYDSWQVHGRDIQVVTAPRQEGERLLKADGLVTRQAEVTLMMRFADCVPIMLADPIQRAVGIGHAGWRGTLLNVAGSLVGEMRSKFGTDPADLLAGIGPSIGPDHYEVGPELAAAAEAEFNGDSGQVILSRDGRQYFDLWEANRMQLESAGVTFVETAGICTACHLEDWYSHRAERAKTGRFSALIQSLD